ncbi:560_t:CDS:1, partial [Ambispora leptoticha]
LDRDEWKDSAVAYQDDVGLWTDGGLKDHIDKFVKLAQSFKQAGLTFAAKKCHLAYKELSMYGYIVGKNGLQVDTKCTTLIEQWQRPICVRDVRSFLGVMNYYRRFVKDFSKIAKPLTELTKKDVGFRWSDEQDKSFQTLKTLLAENVMLKAPNWQDAKNGVRPYQMYVDMYDISLGVVLEQADENGRLRPITFESRKLNAHELHYTVTEKECLSIVYGCNVCERYVGVMTFDIWVEHQALEWLFHKAQLKGCLMQYVENLLMMVEIEGTKMQDLEAIKHYLTNFEWPAHVTNESLPRLRRKLKIYCLIGGQLFRRAAKGKPP